MANKQPGPSPAEPRPGHRSANVPTTPPADVMLNKEELATKLKVAIRTIENWQHEGYLPFIKVSTVVMFHWPTVLAHLQTHFAVKPRGVVGPENKG